MAVPKRKTSPSRRNMRRSHDALAPTSPMTNAPIAASRSVRIMSAPHAASTTGATSTNKAKALNRLPWSDPLNGRTVMKPQELTVSVDAMGGDAGPGIVVAALRRARCVRHPAVRFLLHGDEAVLKPLFDKRAKLAQRVEIRHAAERVRMEEKPSQALRRGRNTSMWRAIECVAKKEAEVAISAGNTGALMAMSMYQLGVSGRHRPPGHRRALADQARPERRARCAAPISQSDAAAAGRFRGDGRSVRPRHPGHGTADGRASQCRCRGAQGQ